MCRNYQNWVEKLKLNFRPQQSIIGPKIDSAEDNPVCNCVIFSICSRPIHHIQFVNSVAVRLQKRSAHEWVFQLPLEYKYRVALQRGEDERHTIVIDLKHLAYDWSSSLKQLFQYFMTRKLVKMTRNVNFLLD